jgi:membrane protease YdiL (CAAX protease family)
VTSPASPPRSGYPDGPPTHPPGWFADPWQTAAWRWWDGYQWTPHTSSPHDGPNRGGPPSFGSNSFGPSSDGPYGYPPVGNAPRTDGGLAPKAIWPSIGWMLLCVLASVVGAIGPVVAVAVVGGSDDTVFVAAICVSYPILFGSMWWVSRRLSRTYGSGDMGRDYGWRRFHRSDIGWGLLAGFAALVAQGIIGQLLRPDNKTYEDAVFGSKHPSTLLLVTMGIATIVGAPLFEELMFRGAIMQSLLGRFSDVPALLLQGVIFALYHVVGAPNLISFWYLTPLFAVGIIFGFAARRTGRLATSQVAHAAMNTIAFLALISTVR